MIQTRLQELYGCVPPDAVGVLHVAAVWAQTDDALTVMRICGATPKSATDFFALNLARARADAIITTGRILREEPSLRYDLQGDAATELLAWRRDQLGRNDPAKVIVLTSGRQLDLEHPAFHSWAEPIVFTGQQAAERIDVSGSRVRVVGSSDTGVRAAIEYASTELGARTISIEAGPSTAMPLYESPCCVDELMLSIFRGPAIPQTVVGRAFLPAQRLRDLLSPVAAATAVDEPSGPWTFQRWERRLRSPAS